MNVAARGSLARVFRGSADAERFQAVLRQQAVERDRRERKEDIDRDDAAVMDFAMGMLTTAEIDSFRLDLDRYDAATVSALQQNGLALERVLARKEELLGKAHMLDDGRRVFKTTDGEKVFDEHGRQLAREAIDPTEIADERPRWEAFKPVLQEHERLKKERDEIIRYQGNLDDARERLDEGDLSSDELEAMRKDLKDAMPDAVRDELPELAVEPRLERDSVTAKADLDLDIADDMIPDAVKSKAPGLSGPA